MMWYQQIPSALLDSPSHSSLALLTLCNVFVLSLGSQEEWTKTFPFGSLSEDRSDPFTRAFINVSRGSEKGWVWDKTAVGRYGGGYIGPAFGMVVHVTAVDDPDDHMGCQGPFASSRRDGRLPPPGEPWIALIKRGQCNFEVKVENAYRSNAAGVIVYNDRDSGNLDKMKLSTDNGRNISAIFTYKWKGEELARLAENDSKVLVHITIADHTLRVTTINRTSVLFVSITFIVLMIISLAWLVFYYVQRFRYIHAKDRLSKRLCNAAKKALSKIPTKIIKSDDKEIQGDGECCAICIEPYKILDVLRILPCSHEFHKNCIDPWLLEQRTCPMCKMDILKHYGFVYTGSQESILHMDIEEVVGMDLTNESSPRRSASGGGISPLPQIRSSILTEHQSYNSVEGDDASSSRASTPNEMTPSLSNRHMLPVRQDLCVSCIAAAAAALVTPSTSADDDEDDVATPEEEEDEVPQPQEAPVSPKVGTSSATTATSVSSVPSDSNDAKVQ
ncbi:PREDICTED: protein goliath-like [Nicrophorus vespilloides]|uniref:Protein goliath-like n=1 Tax=Nicrophorus vespilloides TaxID=110193 RepID=A0ABM1NCB9_NICVS|nr:PREDICTED: protein goliath-like [Nicrophorus vespilloides]